MVYRNHQYSFTDMRVDPIHWEIDSLEKQTAIPYLEGQLLTPNDDVDALSRRKFQFNLHLRQQFRINNIQYTIYRYVVAMGIYHHALQISDAVNSVQ